MQSLRSCVCHSLNVLKVFGCPSLYCCEQCEIELHTLKELNVQVCCVVFSYLDDVCGQGKRSPYKSKYCRCVSDLGCYLLQSCTNKRKSLARI